MTHTRKLIAFSDVTVDGFMAGPDNDLSFVVDDPQLQEEFTSDLMSVTDTIIWGRKSFAPSAAHWTAARGVLADWMNTTPKVVLTRGSSTDVSVWANSKLATGDGADQVSRLKSSSSGGALVVFGGVHTLRSLVAADLVDEYWLKINPTIGGTGGSMFSDVTTGRPLALRRARSFPSGTIAAIYERRAR